MTSSHSQHLQAQRDTKGSCGPVLSTLWVPLEATIEQWADFGKEANTPAALAAAGTAFYALSWEMTALRHYTVAHQERECGNRHVCTVAYWLERVVQDLDCALDQWQQALCWLELVCNHQAQGEIPTLDIMRHLSEQAALQQERRRTLHHQVLEEYASIKQQGRTQRSEKGR